MRYFYLFLAGMCTPFFALSQTHSPLLNIYLDPAGFAADEGFLKQELHFVNHVSDRRLSDVQVQSVYEPVGNGSARFRYLFLGYGRFEGQNDTVTWHLNATEQQGIFREKSLRALKRGLLPYLIQTSWADSLEYHFSPLVNNQPVRDGWNFWTFNINSQAWLSGSHTRQNLPDAVSEKRRALTLRENLSVWQITPEHRLGADLNYEEQNSSSDVSYDLLPDSVDHSEIRIRNASANVYGVRSLGAHWAVGTQMKVSKYADRNYQSDLYSSVTIGLEYNVFPYEQFFRQRLLASVSVGLGDYPANIQNWNKLASASLAYVKIARWGYVEANITEQIIKNRYNRSWVFRCAARTGLNVAKNLFVFAEPVLQQNTDSRNFITKDQRLTKFQYQFFLGLSYYFGSGYRNVVNPRLISLI